MTTRNLGSLERVDVQQIWPHEERNFTVWLADNLQSLQPALGMRLELELIQREAPVPAAGRADILAREVNSKDPIVIENQLTWSDDDHFNRLMSYAAGSEAKGLIWIATGFAPRHLNILNWLNNAGVAVYGLQLSAYRIGDAYAPWFEKVAGPEDPGDGANVAPTGMARGRSLFGRFYPPLTHNLRAEGIFAIGGAQGGWTGRYRSFRSGFESHGVFYNLCLGISNNSDFSYCWAGLSVWGEARHGIYEALCEYQEEINAETADLGLQWGTDQSAAWIWVDLPLLADHADESLQTTRDLMFRNLVTIRNAVQPRLSKVVEGLGLGIP